MSSKKILLQFHRVSLWSAVLITLNETPCENLLSKTVECMQHVAHCSDILITKTETKTRMIDFSFTETKTNTVKILKTETI